MSITNLKTIISFVGNSKPLEDHNKALFVSIKSMAKYVAVAGAAIAASAAFGHKIVSASDAMSKLSRNSEINAKRIQELGFMASGAGADVATMEASLVSVSDALGDAEINGADAFGRLGVSIRDNITGELKTADQVIFEAGQNLNKMGISRRAKANLAASIGIDENLIPLITKSSAELAVLQKQASEFSLVGNEDLKQAEAYNNSINQISSSFESFKLLLASLLAGPMMGVSKGFAKMLKESKSLIIGGIKVMVAIVKTLTKLFIKLWPVLKIVAATFLIVKTAVMAYNAAMALAASPVLLIIAGVVLLALVLEDLYTWFNGGDSVIKGWVEAGKEGFSSFIDGVVEFGGMLIDNIKAPFMVAGEYIANWIKDIKQDIDDVIKAAQRVANVATFGLVDAPEEEAAPRKFTMRVPIGQSAGAGVVNNFTVNQTVKQEISNDNPTQVAKAIRNNLDVNLDNAVAQQNRKVAQ